MARRNTAKKRKIIPDTLYGSKDVAKFICCIMKDGKKSVAEKIVYKAMSMINDKGKDGLEIFNRALSNVMPKVEVVSKRIGGATFMVPVDISETKAKATAMRWIKDAAMKRNDFGMDTKLYKELVDAAGEVNSNSESKGGMEITNIGGGAIKKRDEMHKMAEANKAFAHLKKVITSTDSN